MSSLQTAFEAESLRAAAARALAAVEESPTTIEPIETGNRKQSVIARFAERSPVVVQVCPEQTWLRTEAALLAQIRDQTTVPVPPVLASGTFDGVAYMITPLVTGEDLHERFTGLDSDRQRTLAHSFGQYLAQLHDAFEFEGYGTLRNSGGTLTPATRDWSSWFRSYARTALDRLPAEFDEIRPELDELLTADPADTAPSARLFPWDFRPGNALYAAGDIAAILDWEAPLAAPASLSVAKAEYLVADWYVDDPAPLRDAFERGYETRRAYPEIPSQYRGAAIVDTTVDSTGTVTNPGYPEMDRESSVAFHRRALEEALSSRP
jgi:fructosamine-3-kinase